MNRLLLAILFVAIAVVGQAIGIDAPFSGATLLKAPSGNQFWYVGGKQPMDKRAAMAACAVIGAKLADLRIDDDYEYLSSQINGAAWINSWDGKSLGPFALHAGGAIRALREPHKDLRGVICQAGTAS